MQNRNIMKYNLHSLGRFKNGGIIAMLVKMWRNWSSYMLLVGMQRDAPTFGNNSAPPQVVETVTI